MKQRLIKGTILIILWSILLPQGYARLIMSEHCAVQQKGVDSSGQEQHKGHKQAPHLQYESINKHNPMSQHQDVTASDCNGSDCCPAICAATLLPANNAADMVPDNATGYRGFISRIPLSHPELLLRPPIV